ATRFQCAMTSGFPRRDPAVAPPATSPDDVRSSAAVLAAIQARMRERALPRGARDVEPTLAMDPHLSMAERPRRIGSRAQIDGSCSRAGSRRAVAGTIETGAGGPPRPPAWGRGGPTQGA